LSSTVLIVWQYGANLGHIARLLPIAAALRARGVKVVFAVRDRATALRHLEPLGYPWCVGPHAPMAPAGAAAPVNQAEILLRMGFAQPASALDCVVRWMQLLGALRPDAVLVDESPLALYAARTAGVPCLAIGHGFEIPVMEAMGPCLTPWTQGAQEACMRTEAQLANNLQKLAQCIAPCAIGRAPASVDQLFDPAACILCAWPELDHFDRAVSPGIYSGPIWSELAEATRVDWPDRLGKKVLCYLNLEDKRHDLMWQSLAQHHQANVLVISPSGSPKACEAARGWGITVVEHACLLSPLLTRCDAVIGYGGMGLTSMALHAAKPLLMLPQQLEQMVLAYRLCKRGLALATVRHNHKAGIREKCARLLDGTQTSPQVKAFAQRYADFRPAHAVDAVIKQLLEARR
jgi:hypothetical protein